MERTDNSFLMKPKVDFCFKELMQNDEVRKGFLSACLHLRPEDMKETSLLPTHLRKKHKEDKQGILDIRILLNNNIEINVEMQLAPFKFWRERSLFYVCKMFVEPLEKGNGYGELGKCIHISILNFELFEEDDEFYSRFHLWEDGRKRIYSDKLEIHTLELPKLMKHQYPESILLNWAKFLNAEKKEELEAMAKTNEYIEKAYQELVQLSADKKKRKEYEEREKNLRDYYHQMKYSFLDGVEEGEKTGEERVSKLNLLLLEEKRYDDLEKAAKDQEYRKRLFDEFDL